MILDEFLESNFINAWIYEENLEIYLRKGNRSYEGEILPFIDIGNIWVNKKYRHTGIFTKFLERLENLKTNIFVENIFNDRLLEFLTKRNYVIKSRCAYLIQENE